jgi:hypothetical protein
MEKRAMSSTPVGADPSRQARAIEQQRKALEASRKTAPEGAGPAGIGEAAPASKAGPSAPAPVAKGYTLKTCAAQPAASRVHEPKLAAPEAHAQALSKGDGSAIRGLKAKARARAARGAAASSAAAAPSGLDPRAQELAAAVQKDIQALARSRPEEFQAILEQAFGPLEPAKAEELLAQAQDGKLPLPANVRFVERSELQGPNAAYSPEGGARCI